MSTSDLAMFVDTLTWSSHAPIEEMSLVPASYDQELLAPDDNLASKNYLPISPQHLSSFYSFFWPAHPFLPPHSYLPYYLEKSRDTRLQIALSFIGSKYSTAKEDPATSWEPDQSFSQYPRDGHSIQTLILIAISYHMSSEREIAKTAFARAGEIALSIGLQKYSFATDHGNGDAVIEESWRRTWWELYVLDVMFAALNQSSAQLDGVHLEVPLPCEETLYQSGAIPPRAQNLKDFDSRFFNDDDIVYSSFAYRIAAARTLSKIISGVRKDAPMSSPRREVELELENLILHLPSNMQVRSDGEEVASEVAFQAHMMMHAATIYLHRPQSLLASPNSRYTITCAPNNNGTHIESSQLHTRKAVDAANEICHLISASPALLSHTPFFICAIAMQAIVHLGIYSVPAWAYNRKLAEEQIKMSIGALRKLGGVWEIANAVRQDVKNVAKALLDTSNGSGFSNNEQTASTGAEPVVSSNQTSFAGRISYDDSWIDEFLAGHAAT